MLAPLLEFVRLCRKNGMRVSTAELSTSPSALAAGSSTDDWL